MYVPYKYKSVFDEIFKSKLGCSESGSYYQCDLLKLNNFKLYFVFNGFSHLIANNLIFIYFSLYGRGTILFKEDIDFLGIDTYTMGNYHILI